jgi:phenylacetate-CoA ligase
VWQEKIYNKAPIFLQNLMVSAKGRQIHKTRYLSTHYQRAAEALKANERKSQEMLREMQFQEFQSFVRHCYEFSPYYRRTFEAVQLTPNDIKTPDDISAIPIMPKSVLRSRTQEFFTQPIRRNMVEIHTSGTTGSPLTVYFSKADIGGRYAFLERCRRWAGVRIGQRRASLSGQSIVPEGQHTPPFWRYNRAGSQMLLSSYHLAPENLPAYVKALADFRPQIIDGYPSSIHVIAEFLIRAGDVGRIAPDAVLVTAETVLPHQRHAIETAFQTKLYNQYSSSEGAPFISECWMRRLHVHLDSGWIEILKPDGTPAENGEMGELVVTSFTTHLTPLLRYAIGDATVCAGPVASCECGLPFPTVEAIIGRLDDILYTPDRGYVGRLDPVFKQIPNSVIEAQIVQTTPEEIVLRLVPDDKKYQSKHAEAIIAEMRKRLGQVVTIRVEAVEQIPRTANGKMRSVINLCQRNLPEYFNVSST